MTNAPATSPAPAPKDVLGGPKWEGWKTSNLGITAYASKQVLRAAGQPPLLLEVYKDDPLNISIEAFVKEGGTNGLKLAGQKGFQSMEDARDWLLAAVPKFTEGSQVGNQVRARVPGATGQVLGAGADALFGPGGKAAAADLQKAADLKAAYDQEYNPYQRADKLDSYIEHLEQLSGVVVPSLHKAAAGQSAFRASLDDYVYQLEVLGGVVPDVRKAVAINTAARDESPEPPESDKKYYTFVRSRTASGWGRKTVHERNLTESEARRWCQRYNAEHKPGKKQRMAEFTTMDKMAKGENEEMAKRGLPRLVNGSNLTPEQRKQVLDMFVHRWTAENEQRARLGFTRTKRDPETGEVLSTEDRSPTAPLISDEQWLMEHDFYVRADGTIANKPGRAEPASMRYRPPALNSEKVAKSASLSDPLFRDIRWTITNQADNKAEQALAQWKSKATSSEEHEAIHVIQQAINRGQWKKAQKELNAWVEKAQALNANKLAKGRKLSQYALAVKHLDEADQNEIANIYASLDSDGELRDRRSAPDAPRPAFGSLSQADMVSAIKRALRRDRTLVDIILPTNDEPWEWEKGEGTA